MSAKKNSHCRGGTSYYILYKDFFFEMIYMNGCSMRNKTMCVKKVNRVIFDFILTLMLSRLPSHSHLKLMLSGITMQTQIHTPEYKCIK